MRRGLLFLLPLAFACGAPPHQSACALDVDRMATAWRPTGKIHVSLSQEPWTAMESADAERAVRMGLEELRWFFEQKPAAAVELGGDAIECFLDASYAAGNMPALRDEARWFARRALEAQIADYLKRNDGPAECDSPQYLLALANYAHKLLPSDSQPLHRIVARTNAEFRSCGPLATAMDLDYRTALAAPKLSADDAWALTMWSIDLIDAQLVPGLALPPDARTLPREAWAALRRYPLTGANRYPDGAASWEFSDLAYLATHIPYVPSGYGRYGITIDDSPGLYAFFRENFYPVLEAGDPDLVSEFVDLFREYGCTERDDLQVRDGARWLLKRFHASGDRWMAVRAPDESDPVSDYHMIHKPWTGVSGLRARAPEPAIAGTYGGIVRGWPDAR